MKKFLSVCLLALVAFSCVHAEDEVEQRTSLTSEEREVCQKFYGKLSDCYAEMMTNRPEIAAAFQEVAGAFQKVADENRADFEMVRDLTGACLENGTPALPVNIPMAIQ